MRQGAGRMKKANYMLLSEAKRLDGEIKRRTLHIEELETILMPKAIRYDIEKVQHEPVDNLADIVVEIAQLRTEIVDLQSKMIEATKKIRGMIETLENENQKNVLTCRFIRCMTQEVTAQRIGYTKRHIQRIEAEGKAELDKRMRKKCR